MGPKEKTLDDLSDDFADLLNDFREARPDERSELSRRFAVTITQLEQAYAYFETYIVRRNYDEEKT